jgi:folate-dependent tRNA-U54 methylase TrmFO/GidA
MTIRATFSLDKANTFFLQKIAGSNKSAYINNLLKKEQQHLLEENILKANKEESEDVEYQKTLTEWDVTLSDGLTK